MKTSILLWFISMMLAFTARAQLGSVYFKVTTLGATPSGPADTWTGAFEVEDLSATVRDTFAVSLSTSFVGGIASEPGFTFDSGSDIFVWQGDVGGNSTIQSESLVAAITGSAPVSWSGLIGQSFALLAGVTTDLQASSGLRVSGQGGTIEFSDTPFPTFDPYAEWLANYPALTDTSKSADPDGDGFDNGTEFAFDGDPTVGTPALLTIVHGATNAIVSFVAHNTLFPNNYVVLSSTNLQTTVFATNGAATGSVVSSADQSGLLLSNTYTRKQFTVPIWAKEFYRVKALLP